MTARRRIVLVAAGGAIGTGGRDALMRAVSMQAGHVPTTTLAINLFGAFLLGCLLAKDRRGDAVAFLGTGLCGAFTTWSTFMLELRVLQQGDHLAVAFVYAGLALVGGLLCARLGLAWGRRP